MMFRFFVSSANFQRIVEQRPSSVSKLFARNHHLLYTQLDSRSLIRVTGSDSLPFLQGLITNNIQDLHSQPSIFTVFLNQAGRILFDSIIYKSSSQDTVLIECDSHVQQTLIRHLKLYRVRKNVQVEDVAGELKPNVIWDPSHLNIPTCLRVSAAGCSEAQTPAPQNQKEILEIGADILGIPDPRVDALGWRLLLPVGKDLDSLKGNVQKSTEHNYRILLYALGIGEGFLDFPIGNSFPLESNLDFLNGVNFHKGCYIGQELTARTHHTGVVRKRLMPFRIPGSINIPPEVDKSTLKLLNQAGRPVAKVRNIIDTYGLALARVDEALASTEVKLGDHVVQLEKPLWWPSEAAKQSLSDN